MTNAVADKMGEGANGKSQLIRVLSVPKEALDEVSRANVVRQAGNEAVGERIIAEVLDQTTTIGKGMSFPQLFGARRRIAAEQKWDDARCPCLINQLMVRENAIRGCRLRAGQAKPEEQCKRKHLCVRKPPRFETMDALAKPAFSFSITLINIFSTANCIDSRKPPPAILQDTSKA
jgi:hypothetical protein